MATRQTDLLSVLQKSARNGTLLSSCDPEVRELMHQIDVLISGKQAEWAGQWTGLETQLREKERELGAVRHTLWQKDTELGQVNEKYEQLKARRQHKYSSLQGVSARKTSEEILQLRQDKQVLEETNAHLEEERTVLEGQLNLARLETTALQEKCAALEGEVKFCRSQLEQKDTLVAAIEQSHSVRGKQLQAQLKRSQELAEARALALQKVHGELEEKRREAEAASAEVLSLNSQLSHSQASVRQLRGKYAELQGQVQKLEDQLKMTGTQLSQREHSMRLLQESTQKKDKLIKSLGGRKAQVSEVSRLKQELSHAHSQLQAQSQRERELREELTSLQQRSVTDREEVARLTAKCASQDRRLAEELTALSQKHSTELNQLRSQLSKMARDNSPALKQTETKCGARHEGLQKPLEERLRPAGGKPTASGLTHHLTSNGSTREKATRTPTSLTAHHTTKHNNPSTLSTPITLPTTGSSPLPHTSLPSSAIIGKFLQETDRISRKSSPAINPPLRNTKTPPELKVQYQSQQENVVSESLPFPLTTTSSTGYTDGEGFVPLQPVSRSEASIDLTASEAGTISSAAGDVRSRGGEEKRKKERRGGREGRRLEREESSCEPQELEEMFSKTLDSIVDRHFQQLDTSLRTLMTKES